MIPSKKVGKLGGSKPFAKSDTFFSVSSPYYSCCIAWSFLTSVVQEFESHNDPSLILSESPDSYIISNLASYDGRQYRYSGYKEGERTPEGQGFGHCLVICRRRIFNIVDPDATADHCALLKEMKEHFITFWKTESGSPKLLKRVRSTFDEQNNVLVSKDVNGQSCEREDFLSMLKRDCDALSKSFLQCKPDDFEYAFHAYPANSVGHLHMHVFPKKNDLRAFSTKDHDWKTIPIEAVLEVEEEDERPAVEPNSG